MNAARRTTAKRLGARRWLGPALGLALALIAGAASAQDGPSRVGYVDMQRLIDNAPHMLAARARLKQEFDQRDAALKQDEARLAGLDLRLKDEAATLPAAELATLQRQADALRRSVERTRQRLREEFGTRVDQELDRTWPLINEAVADFAREQGYDLIVQSPVIYVSGRIDVTDRVLDRLKSDYSQAKAEQP
jgi:outer membrane protein